MTCTNLLIVWSVQLTPQFENVQAHYDLSDDFYPFSLNDLVRGLGPSNDYGASKGVGQRMPDRMARRARRSVYGCAGVRPLG